ncbi:GNAT family N-acetyltransferase [Streptacidiphilus sp. ASG 303]|uniref:GNAT family N-acetyltransferase n=1 Tax=Streptacidiphilus sp. ASG 303 TaxID=2896847 RepID=UPI001E2B63F0|nr:GNAT family N-acetyltransferase [Streptacidiphilus sp. ASG 303]MCD0482122.1 GNAT family N-acetyltransferase [Streptacidiphilus sp. ASG 303]
MKIRTGGPDDAPALLALLDDAVAWLVSLGRTGQWGTEPWSARPAAADRVRRYARDHLVRVAETGDGRPAGVCVLAEEPPEYAPPVAGRELYVRLLVTDRALSGSGVGRALVEDAAAEARRRGIALLRVDCYDGDDHRLVRQYEALGFTAADGFTVEVPGREPWPGRILERRP